MTTSGDEGRYYTKATQMLWHGLDANEAKLWHKAWAKNGAPILNRAERRKTAKAKRRGKKR